MTIRTDRNYRDISENKKLHQRLENLFLDIKANKIIKKIILHKQTMKQHLFQFICIFLYIFLSIELDNAILLINVFL